MWPINFLRCSNTYAIGDETDPHFLAWFRAQKENLNRPPGAPTTPASLPTPEAAAPSKGQENSPPKNTSHGGGGAAAAAGAAGGGGGGRRVRAYKHVLTATQRLRQEVNDIQQVGNKCLVHFFFPCVCMRACVRACVCVCVCVCVCKSLFLLLANGLTLTDPR